MKGTALLTGIFLLGMIGLSAADALLVEGIPATAHKISSASSASSVSSVFIDSSSETSQSSQTSTTSATSPTFQASSISPVDITPPPRTPTTSASEGAVTQSDPEQSRRVKKRADAGITETILALGYTVEPSEEQSLLSAVVQKQEGVSTQVLLREGDRAGLISWIETPSVKQVYLVLKESLHSLFSAEVRDLLDENQTPPGKPPRSFLTFLDPAISEERIVFVRIRERLLEFHIAPGREDAMYQLVEALTE